MVVSFTKGWEYGNNDKMENGKPQRGKMGVPKVPIAILYFGQSSEIYKILRCYKKIKK